MKLKTVFRKIKCNKMVCLVTTHPSTIFGKFELQGFCDKMRIKELGKKSLSSSVNCFSKYAVLPSILLLVSSFVLISSAQQNKRNVPLRKPVVDTRGQRDCKEYRKQFSELEDDPSMNENLLFYKGKTKSRPEGEYIENILNNWRGNNQLLEKHHGYIQWLFPIAENSNFNSNSQKLFEHERDEMVKDEQCMIKMRLAYSMMLNFYGIEFVDEKKGTLKRAKDWRERFDNLEPHLFSLNHNALR